MSRTKVAVIDARPVYEEGLKAALSEAGFTYEPAQEIDWAGEQEKRVVMVVIPSHADMTVIKQLRSRLRCPIMALLDDPQPYRFGEALIAGADTAAASSASKEEIIGVLKAALERRASLPMKVALALAERKGCPPDTSLVTTEDIEWLRALGEGSTVAELANKVGYSEREMYRCLGNLYRRMGASSRVDALIQAARWGLLD